MSIDRDWRYINIYLGQARDEGWVSEATTQWTGTGDAEYGLVIDTPLFRVIRWLNGDSIHIYIHGSLLMPT